MNVEQHRRVSSEGWRTVRNGGLEGSADLVLVFGSRELLQRGDLLADIRAEHDRAVFLGCSTAGEISGTEVLDDSLTATIVRFKTTQLASAVREVTNPANSLDVGKELGLALPHAGLRHVLVLSSGLAVNGSELVSGITSELPVGVTATGGLSGDGDRFEETLVLFEADVSPTRVVALGLYGDDLCVGYGSLGGWDPFGPQRLITRSEGNVLYTLDDQPALDLYRRYLGEHADGLPATGLLYPLSVSLPGTTEQVVRTILGIDEQKGTMTFAGDLPQGATARLMKANFERLIDGAGGAAHTASLPGSSPDLAILVSCVGRKLVLKQRVEEEVEAVRDCLGETVLTGFYSYGEISPFTPQARCELHNQTMTVTSLSEG